MPTRKAEAEWNGNLAEARVPGIDDTTFQQYALDAKQNCPVSKALAGTEIHLSAKLI